MEDLRGQEDGGCYGKLLLKFAKLGKFEIKKFESNDPGKLHQLFIQYKAGYHHSCVAKFNQQNRAERQSLKSKLQTLEVPDDNDSKRARRNDPSAKIRLGELKCLFC